MTTPKHKMNATRTNHKRIEYSRTKTAWTKLNWANQLHPGSPILALQNQVTSCYIKIQTEKWTEKIFVTGGPLVKLWIFSDAETLVRKPEDWWNREMHYPGQEPWDAGTITKHNGPYLHLPTQTKGAEMKLRRLMQKSWDVQTGWEEGNSKYRKNWKKTPKKER